MGLRGSLIGSVIGSFFFRPVPLLGSFLGAFVGHKVEERFFKKNRPRQRPRGEAFASPRDLSLEEAYALLCARPSASDDVLRRKYRDLAKNNHPDILRSQGLSEEMIGKATERMGRINNAWSEIRTARGL